MFGNGAYAVVTNTRGITTRIKVRDPEKDKKKGMIEYQKMRIRSLISFVVDDQERK